MTTIFVDFGSAATVEGVLAVSLRAADPVVIAAFDIEIIRFEAGSFEALEFAAPVINHFAGFREGDPADSRGADETF